MKALFRAAAIGALIVAGTAQAAAAQTAPSVADTMFRATTINLSAYGETKIAPDIATISLGVQTEAPTAAEAMRQNAAQMNKVVDAIKRAGVQGKDIQTSGLNLSPQYAYVQNEQPRLTGYQASNQVVIIVRDLAKVGQVVDATVNSGANTVGGISFGLADPSAAEDAARVEAVKTLQARADLYARSMGYRVGRLVSLNEGGGYSPVPPPMPMMAMARAEKFDAGSPVEGGTLRVRMDVSATFELVR